MSLKSILTSACDSRKGGSALLGLMFCLSIPAMAQEAVLLPSAMPLSGAFQLTEGAATAITASFSRQSYTTVAANATGTGLQFGGAQNTNGADAKGLAAWTTSGSVSGASEAMLSDASGNAFSVFTTTRPLAAAGLPTEGRYFMGQLKLSFGEPINNPVLQLIGLGATSGALGITTELELATKGITLSKAAGNANLMVEEASIYNDAAHPDASSASGAATGSISVQGGAISELVFDVYLRGDGAAVAWEASGQYNGDRWLISLAKQAPASVALPVYVTDFTATPEAGCGVRLRWKTATELGITALTVEHSADGIQFNDLTTFTSVGGAEGQSYTYSAHDAANGANYYRLRIDNTTAQNDHTKIVPLRVSCFDEHVNVQPNPATDFLTIKGISAGDRLSLLDVRGMEVKKLVAEGAQASMGISDLKEGLYMLFVRDARGELMSSARVQKQ